MILKELRRITKGGGMFETIIITAFVLVLIAMAIGCRKSVENIECNHSHWKRTDSGYECRGCDKKVTSL